MLHFVPSHGFRIFLGVLQVRNSANLWHQLKSLADTKASSLAHREFQHKKAFCHEFDNVAKWSHQALTRQMQIISAFEKDLKTAQSICRRRNSTCLSSIRSIPLGLWIPRHFVPRQLQQTTWLTSPGYCRSKHTHRHTDFFRYKPPLVPDTVYARLDGSWGSQICKIPGIRFPEVSGKFLLAASVEIVFFWGFFEKQSSGKVEHKKTGGKLGIRDSFCKWCTELCFHDASMIFLNDQYIFFACRNLLFAALHSWY